MSSSRSLLVGLTLVASFVAAGRAVADWPGPDAGAKVPALADEAEKLEQGLTLTLQAGGQTDSRDARLVALFVAADRPASAMLKAGPLKATWSGNLNSRIRDTIALSARGAGKIHVTVNDQPALEAIDGKAGATVKLNKGKNKLVVEYAGPEAGGADIRLFWQSDSFEAEPVPPTIFTHDVADKALRRQSRVRLGREVFAESHCVKCHAPGEAAPKTAMPELSADAPSLADVGSRLNEGWMAAWIADPKSQRPQATMPKVLHGAEAAGRAKDIAAYLATLGKANGAAPTGDETAGARLYLQLGCIACHTTPDAEKGDPTRVPHNVVKAKWQPAALVEFLKQPEKHYPWTRMPNFRLSDEEASNLAAYLIAKSPDANHEAGGDAVRGKAALASAGCLNCHAGAGATEAKLPSLADVMKSDWTKGCLAADDAGRGTAPAFSFSDEQRAALQSLAVAGLNTLLQDAPAEIANRQIAALNCVACHTRDGKGDNWSTLDEVKALEAALPQVEEKGEHYSPDQSRPQLTWTGEKLKSEWAGKFISGKLSYKPRPWLRARMPGFPAHGDLIAAGLANDHGYPAASPAEHAPNPELAAIGQKLIGKDGGFSCVQCHGVGSVAAGAAFEAPGVNFVYVKDRLRHDYYVRWVRNPQRVERGTRMPTFVQSDGKTAVKDTLDGDAGKQFDAIWNYLLQGAEMKPPAQ